MSGTPPADMKITVWDPIATLPATGLAYQDFTDSASTARNDPNYCPKTYSVVYSSRSSASALTTFTFDATLRNFQIYSDSLFQVGTFYYLLKVASTEYPTNYNYFPFNVNVLNPCLLTTLIQPTVNLVDMSTTIRVTKTQQVGYVDDSVSVAQGNGLNICGIRTYSISSVVASATSALNSAELTISSSGLISIQATNQFAPTSTLGTHTATVKVYLGMNTTRFITLPSFTITIDPCIVTSVKVVRSDTYGSIVNQVYTLSSTAILSVLFNTLQTPSCGYEALDWVVSATGPQPANFTTITTWQTYYGIYKVGPTTSTSQVGSYTIQITKVVINSIIYDGSSPAQTLISPSSFVLTVVNPCSTTLITTQTISPISIQVWDAEANYPTSGVAFTEFADSVGTTNGDPTMCPKTYSATISTNAGGKSLTKFQLLSSQFILSSQSYDQIGTYTVTLKCSITAFPTIFATKTFTVTVTDPCINTILLDPSPVIPNMATTVLAQVSIGGPPLYVTQYVGVIQDTMSQNHGDISGTQYCGARKFTIVSITQQSAISALLSPSEVSININTGIISVYTADSSKIGTHVVTVEAKLFSYPSITKQLTTFIIDIKSCIVQSLKVVQDIDKGSISAQQYVLSGTQKLNYQLTTIQIPNCGHPSSNWIVTATGIMITNFQSISSSGLYSVGPTTTPNQEGVYTIAITSVVVNGITYDGLTLATTLVQPSSFTLTVLTPCAATLVQVSTLSSITLAVWEVYSANSYVFPDFTDSSSIANNDPNMCPKTYTASISTNAVGKSLTTFNLNGGLKQFDISSESYDQIGTFTVTIKGEVTAYPTQFATGTFEIIVTDPCLNTNLVQPNPLPSNIQTSVLVQASPGGMPFYETQQIGVFTDVISSAHGDGVDVCGARTYSITTSINSATTSLSSTELFINLNTGIISVYTARSAVIGTHSVYISSKMTRYTSKQLTLSPITITIIPCIVTGYTMQSLSPFYDKSYLVTDLTKTWSIVGSSVTTQVPACGYTQTLTLSLSATQQLFVTATPGQSLFYSVYTHDLLYIGTNSLTVTSTLNSYNFSPPIAIPTCDSTFTLEIQDPCLSTLVSIVPDQIMMLATFSGQNITSMVKYSFNDSSSFVLTRSTDISDYCGEKILSFKINNTDTTLLNGTNKDNMIFMPPQNTTNFGYANASVVATMNNYPSIQSAALLFTVAILRSERPLIPDYAYKVNSSMLQIIMDPFRVFPYDYDTGVSSVQAYLYTAATPLTSIDLTCSCLTQVNALPWVNFNEELNSLSIFTNSNAYAGIQKLVLVQSFVDFPLVNPFSSFNIVISPIIIAAKKKSQPPYFKPALQTQSVTQCPDTASKLWTFTLPEQIDPQQSQIFVQLSFDSTFFTYDKSSQTINQIKLVEKPLNQTVKIILSNELNLKTEHQMQVQFVCQVAKNFTFSYSLKDQEEQFAKQKSVPNATIAKISPSGILEVKFEKVMKVPDHPEQINPTNIITLEDEDFPILQLEVVAGKYSEKTLLKFNWTFVEFSSTKLILQLNFENQNYISSHTKDPEQIKLTIYGFQYFADILGNYMMPKTVLNLKILPQIATVEELNLAQNTADAAKSMMNSAMLANTVVMIVISGPMQQLLNSVKQLQIIVHIMLIDVAFPQVTMVFMGMFMSLLTFQFYDFGKTYDWIFSLDPNSPGNSPFNGQFNIMGYNALYIIKNFGTLCITPFLGPLYWIALHIASALKTGLFQAKKLYWNKMMRYNYWIGLLHETYMFLSVCAGLNLLYFKWGTYGDSFNSFFTLFFGLLLFAFPLFVAIFYAQKINYNKILKLDEEFLTRFGSCISGLNFKRQNRTVLFYASIGIFRKLWLAYIVVFQQKYSVFSIFQVNAQALLMMVVLGYTNPMVSIAANRLELANEGFILIITYHLYQFTAFMTDLGIRMQVGQSLLLITVLNVGLNLAVVGFQSGSFIARKLKLKYMEHKQRKRIELARLTKQLRVKQEAHRQVYMARYLNQSRLNIQIINRIRQLDDQLEQLSEISEHEESDQPTQIQATIEAMRTQTELAPQPRELVLKASRKLTQSSTAIEKEPPVTTTPKSSLKQSTEPQLVSVKVKPHAVQFNLKNNKIQQSRNTRQETQVQTQTTAQVDPNRPLVQKEILASYTSQYHKTKIEVKQISFKGEIQHFTVYSKDREQKTFLVSKRDTQDQISSQKQAALQMAQQLVQDIPENIQDEINSGNFERVLQQYSRQRWEFYKFNQPHYSNFVDYGSYRKDMPLIDKIELYNVLKNGGYA